MKVRDLLRGLLLESGNDAAVTLAEGVSGSRRAFVREMNRRARELKLKNTHFANPIGLDQEGNYSTARDLVKLATFLRTNAFFKKIVDSPSGTLKSGDHPRTFANRNRLVRRHPFVNGVKTGHTRGAGYVLVGSASRKGIQLVSAVLATPSEAARDSDTLALYKWAFPRFTRVTPVVRGRRMATAQIRYRPGATLKLVAAKTVRRIVARADRKDVTVAVYAPEVVEGPIAAASGSAAPRCRQDGRVVATVPLVAAGAIPAAGITQRTKSCGVTPARPRRHRRRPGRYRPAARTPPLLFRTAASGGPRRMIVTVTLNTAIDKTLSVPNFRLGRRHRTVEQTTMPGGKGVNVARLLKTLGAPVIATGLAGGATGTRIVDQLTQMSVLSDFVRIGEESRTNTAVIDPTTGEQTEINERGPKVTPREVELFVDKLLYLAKGATLCVFAGSLPRDVDVDIYAHLIRELRRLNVTTVVDTDGDPLRRAVRAEPDVISPNVLEAEELVGHEFNDDEDRTYAVREMCELGAREAIMTMPDGCFARVHPGGGEPRSCRVRVRGGAIEPRATVGSGDAFLAGFVAARYQRRPVEEALAFGVACGAESTQHLGAGLLDPDRVERLLGEVEVERPAPVT